MELQRDSLLEIVKKSEDFLEFYKNNTKFKDQTKIGKERSLKDDLHTIVIFFILKKLAFINKKIVPKGGFRVFGVMKKNKNIQKRGYPS